MCACEEERAREGEHGALCFHSDIFKWKILQNLTGMKIIKLDKQMNKYNNKFSHIKIPEKFLVLLTPFHTHQSIWPSVCANQQSLPKVDVSINTVTNY